MTMTTKVLLSQITLNSSISLGLVHEIKMGSVQSSDNSIVTVDRMMSRHRRMREINLLEEMEQLEARMVRITFERPTGLSGSSGSNNNVQPLVTRVAFQRVSTTESDGTMRPWSSSSSSSSTTEDDVTFDDVLQILFHQVPILRHVYLMSEFDSRDEEYKLAEQKALLEFVEEYISNNDIYAPAA